MLRKRAEAGQASANLRLQTLAGYQFRDAGVNCATAAFQGKTLRRTRRRL